MKITGRLCSPMVKCSHKGHHSREKFHYATFYHWVHCKDMTLGEFGMRNTRPAT